MPIVTPSLIAATPALLALRRGVTVCATLVCLALVVQAAVFGCVHFTSVRYASAATVVEEKPLTVVPSVPKSRVDLATLDQPPQEPPRALGTGDQALGWISTAASVLGALSMIVLLVQAWIGVVIAAAAGAAGMQRGVAGATRCLIAGVFALPLVQALTGGGYAGALGGYGSLVAASSAARVNGTDVTTVALYGLGPLLLACLVFWGVWASRVGLSGGLARSESDPAVEAEVAAVLAHGASSLHGSRAAGELQRTLQTASGGEVITTKPPAPGGVAGLAASLPPGVRIAGDNEAERALLDLEKVAGRHRVSGETPLRPTGTEPLRRPI